MRRPATCCVLAACLLDGAPAAAHAFGQRYDLPLPLWLFIAAAGSAVALSFAVMAMRVRRADIGYPSIDLLATPLRRLILRPAPILLLRIASVGLFLLAVLAGLIGVQDPFRNIAPTLVWVIWWVGIAYVSAFLGDVWRLINPPVVLFDWAEAAARRFGVALGGRRPWPKRLGAWPAVLLLFLFAWAEIVWHGGETPRNIAVALLTYSLLSWAAMAVFGREAWLTGGDAFAMVFGLLARFAPFGFSRQANGETRLLLRPPAIGLLAKTPVSRSTMAFVLLMLATVTFDGFRETPVWAAILDALLESPALVPALRSLQASGLDLGAFLTTSGLAAFFLLFLLVYRLFARAMTRAAGEGPDADTTARLFVLTLIPIALAYHLAHYFSLLLIAGQLVIPLASDPFGFGWDLFGTALYRIRIDIVDAKLVWHVAVTAIVLGHVAAVYLGHRIAVAVYPTARAALRSQVPMLALMVGYTMTSLWILAQPVVQE
ncbi:MAG: hypothetical protein ACREF6_04680 [Alphaproteobacteria bacterium]